jgi:hypothetical protein
MRLLNLTVHLSVVVLLLGLLSPPCLQAELEKLQLEEPKAKIGRRVFKDAKQQLPPWVIKVGQLYIEPDNDGAIEQLLTLLESNLGIEADGSLNIIKAWDSKYDLAGDVNSTMENWEGDAAWWYRLRDNFSLTGFNHLYFKICMTYQDRYADRFVRYFENGFYPNQALFAKNAHYYQSLYYYLYLIAPSVSNTFTRAIAFFNKYPEQDPEFMTPYDMRRFNTGVAVATELDQFISRRDDASSVIKDTTFSRQERDWIKNTTDYFLSTQTHSALLSYDWFRRNIPLQASAEAISHSILTSWNNQAIIYRTRLPLMFFTEEGKTQVNIESLFDATLQKLRLDNRKVDIMVLTALQSWLSKQVRQGIKIDDRIKYNNILAELKACPSGWIFANLYDCRKNLGELKTFAENWNAQKQPEKTFQTRVADTFLDAKNKIDAIFSDLEKIIGSKQTAGPANYIFYQYRGEIIYYFKYLQFETFQGKNVVLPIAGPEANFLNDFKTAFMAAPQSNQNHINLLKGYHLLFRKLFAAGRIDEIQKRERELEAFINGRHSLGSRLSHEENNLYDIYRVLTYAYLSYERFETKALETAKKSFLLSKKYYLQAARQAGYAVDGKIGAITRENTEMDDYQRQFELYKTVANQLGKKIRLLVAENDIRLYNKMQEMRKAGI